MYLNILGDFMKSKQVVKVRSEFECRNSTGHAGFGREQWGYLGDVVRINTARASVRTFLGTATVQNSASVEVLPGSAAFEMIQPICVNLAQLKYSKCLLPPTKYWSRPLSFLNDRLCPTNIPVLFGFILQPFS